MRHFRKTCRRMGAAAVSLALAAQGAQAATYSTREALNLYALGSTATLGTESLRRLGYVPDSSRLTFNGGFSDTGFWSSSTGSVDGQDLQLNYTGSLSGDFGDTMTIDIALSGFLGTNDITGTSTMRWAYDPSVGGYQAATLEEHGEINPIWFWAAGVVLFLAITSTAHAPGPADVEYDPTPDDPDDTPDSGDLDISEDGDISGSINGTPTFDGSASGGSVSGNVTAVPEPSAALSALLGALVAGGLGWHRRRAAAA